MNRLERDKFQMAIGLLVMLTFVLLVGALLLIEMPPSNKETLLLLIGVLAGSFKDIVGWAFGSSKGSVDKNDLLKPQTGA